MWMAANPEVWESLKREFNEPYDNQYVRDQFNYCKKYNLHIEDRMIVVPVPFSVEGAKMLQHAKWLMEDRRGWQQLDSYRQTLRQTFDRT